MRNVEHVPHCKPSPDLNSYLTQGSLTRLNESNMLHLGCIQVRKSKKSEGFILGCPRNNHIFFSVRTETNRNSICFDCFSVYFAKPKNIFLVCFGLFRCFKTTEPNKTLSKQTKTNRKNRQKTLSIRGPRNS